MIWSDLHGDVESRTETVRPLAIGLRPLSSSNNHERS